MSSTINLTIESLDSQGIGVAHINSNDTLDKNGKTVFIAGVLPGEEVSIAIYQEKPSFAKARLIDIITASKERVQPKCPHFAVCGGCSLQHINEDSQVNYKQQTLIATLKHIAGINLEQENNKQAISADVWHYRHRARLSVRYVAKKGGTLVGFHEKASSYVADMHECHILPQHISDLIPHLRKLIDQLSIRERIPQIEVAVGAHVTVLVLRILAELSANDETLLRQFIDAQQEMPLQFWLQPGGVDSCYVFYPQNMARLSYLLPEFDLELPYLPNEFTQINPQINRLMVSTAIKLLNLQANERIADFFCGIGNFSLAIARLPSIKVTGFEGSNTLVMRAKENAQLNNLSAQVEYYAANLFTIDDHWLKQWGRFDKWLIDPPRDGAVELLKAITKEIAPKVIIYVSCNPATLARDVAILTKVHGYTLVSTQAVNMFPQTSHTESISKLIC